MIFKEHYEGQAPYIVQMCFKAVSGYSLVGFYDAPPERERMWSNGLFMRTIEPNVS